uniref:tRNA(Phe) (4-demethylwyosine(37)-C(7)) aminocarboxypropyltransferase n=1 Tax=Rhizophora mucronata TaxID=61149 RepID=A0A2P2KSH5_RHIMU
MFSWGNLSEKLRMAHLHCEDEVVVDLFAGIGYFTLPFLVRAKAKLVYACEWNPYAVEALKQNLHANSVSDRCIVLEGDNRLTAPEGVANRVCLGLLPTSEGCWVTAVRALRKEGGVLHVHGNAKDTEESEWSEHIIRSFDQIARSEGYCWEVSLEHVQRVKWYAPHVRHLVADVRCKHIQH